MKQKSMKNLHFGSCKCMVSVSICHAVWLKVQQVTALPAGRAHTDVQEGVKQVCPAKNTESDTMSCDAKSLGVSAKTCVRSRGARHVQYIVVSAVSLVQRTYWPLVRARGWIWLLRRSPSSG